MLRSILFLLAAMPLGAQVTEGRCVVLEYSQDAQLVVTDCRVVDMPMPGFENRYAVVVDRALAHRPPSQARVSVEGRSGPIPHMSFVAEGVVSIMLFPNDPNTHLLRADTGEVMWQRVHVGGDRVMFEQRIRP